MNGQATSARSPKQAGDSSNPSEGLPVTRSLKLAYLFSLLIAVLTAVASIAVLILNPLLTGEPFALTDVIVVFVMSLITIVPLILFIRGVRKS